MKQYGRNQGGAALLLVLFVILFLSIVGTTLLTATTYSMKTIVKNVEEQEEFYRAEGAIEIYLNELVKEMNNYSNSYLNTEGEVVEEKGPYFYLLREHSLNPSLGYEEYTIGEKTLVVNGSIIGTLQDPNHPSFNPDKVSPVSVRIEAAYKNNSSIKRIAELTIDASAQKITKPTPDVPEIDPFPVEPILGYDFTIPSDVNKQYEPIVGRLNEEFEDVIKFYGFENSIGSGTLRIDYPFSEETKYHFENIEITKGSKLTIPAGHIVFVDSAHFTGEGNKGETTLQVDGILLFNDLQINGNMDFQINGVIVANILRINTAAIDIGVHAGLEPDGTGGGYTPPSNSGNDYSFSSSITNKIDLKTERY